MGRAIFKVRAIRDEMWLDDDFDFGGSCKRHEMLAAAFDLTDESTTEDPAGGDPPPTCRLCYDQGLAADNPLLSLCGCKGTLKFVHLRCLKACLQSRLQYRGEDSYASYYWSSFGCELCRTPYPSKEALKRK